MDELIDELVYKVDQLEHSCAEAHAIISELKTAYADKESSRQRAIEYPKFGSQLNKIYDDGVTKWKSEMVDPVKAKWPKDNSGPV